ncbi:MAG: cytochrome c [Pseudomonadaceae bacterium]|nr:cytochrome c [Pseudomonadaceae bacterium]
MAIRFIVAGFILSLLSACGSEPLDGAALAQEKGCVACHGAQGKALVASYPNLNGQWERYLRLQLRAYRDGPRVNAIMNGMAAELTDQEINALAAHYGRES